MKRRTELYPHEQLMLLALRDDKGTLESKASMHSFALGGALLAELSIQGRISIDDTKKAMVDVVDRRPHWASRSSTIASNALRPRNGARGRPPGCNASRT